MPKIEFPIPFIGKSIVFEAYFSGGANQYNHTIDRTYNKVFVIGHNKTGTTSVKQLLQIWGFHVGDQSVAEVLSLMYLRSGDSSDIIRYCHTAEAFQDVPFSLGHVYKDLDKEFPNSKFILTVRNNEHEWYDSLVRFHTKAYSTDSSRPPTATDLQQTNYRLQGLPFEYNTRIFELKSEDDIYNPSIYKANYLKWNDEKRAYFRDRPNDFLEINLQNPVDFERLSRFLKIDTPLTEFPHLNQS